MYEWSNSYWIASKFDLNIFWYVSSNILSALYIPFLSTLLRFSSSRFGATSDWYSVTVKSNGVCLLFSSHLRCSDLRLPWKSNFNYSLKNCSLNRQIRNWVFTLVARFCLMIIYLRFHSWKSLSVRLPNCALSSVFVFSISESKYDSNFSLSTASVSYVGIWNQKFSKLQHSPVIMRSFTNFAFIFGRW